MALKSALKQTNNKKTAKNENVPLMPDVVATNCNLSNRLIDLNKVVMKKSDDLLKMQELYHNENVKNIKLETIVAEKDNKILQLERTIKDMKESQYCHDLIQLDDSVPCINQNIDEGEFVNFH